MAISDLIGGASVATFATGYVPQMILGSFVFSLNTAAFQELNRDTAFRWASQERFAAHEALQFLGPGEDIITLPGVIYPSFRGGAGQLDKLRALGRGGQPLQLIDGTGNVLGRWVVENVNEKRSHLAAFGMPRKQEFTIKLRHFDGGTYNAFLNLLSSLF